MVVMFRKINFRVLLSFFCLVGALNIFAQNPYLPGWEHVPDGEPRVFGDRVYIYGSHDSAGSKTFCGKDHVVWSAPLNNLTKWEYHGIVFRSKATATGKDDIPWSDNDLYAPDVVEKGGKYYLYFYVVGAPGGVAVSDSPAGPFKLVSKIVPPAGAPSDFGGWGQFIDPGVLVDDDGKVYIYWGYKSSHMAQINPDNMYEILPNTYQADIIPTTKPFNFFEAASMRKINGTYYFVYADGGILVYATSKSPKGPFVYGGPINRNGIEYPGGNNHGSLCQLNGQWYIFYHRMTNNTIMSRKACAEKVTIEADGSIKEVGMTSLGFSKSLNPYKENSVHIACVLKGGNYITQFDSLTHPVIKNKNNCVVGFKYYDFGKINKSKKQKFTAQVNGCETSGQMEIWLDADSAPKGTKIGTVAIDKNSTSATDWTKIATKVQGVSGNHALYFKFISDNSEKIICNIKSFGFKK